MWINIHIFSFFSRPSLIISRIFRIMCMCNVYPEPNNTFISRNCWVLDAKTLTIVNRPCNLLAWIMKSIHTCMNKSKKRFNNRTCLSLHKNRKIKQIIIIRSLSILLPVIWWCYYYKLIKTGFCRLFFSYVIMLSVLPATFIIFLSLSILYGIIAKKKSMWNERKEEHKIRWNIE